MARCLISFGANLGQPAVTIGQAVALLRERLGGDLQSLELSRLVRTPAVGGPTGQPPFINAVAALRIDRLSAWDVWHTVREIEHRLGRVRQERWEARRIDLDVLLFDDQRIWTQHFKLPHPRMIMRRFILEPALDVAADWPEPVSGWTLQQLAESLRRGPASLGLVSFQAAADQQLLELVAMRSQSQWARLHLTGQLPSDSHTRLRDQPGQRSVNHSPATQRWIGLIDATELTHAAPLASLSLSAWPKLLIVLAPTIIKHGAAWEDIHRELASWMHLYDSPVVRHWPLPGPRYLLASDDAQWAQHEILAAIEAMDCPVERINNDFS